MIFIREDQVKYNIEISKDTMKDSIKNFGFMGLAALVMEFGCGCEQHKIGQVYDSFPVSYNIDEKGLVKQKIYAPSTNVSGSGVGINLKGDLGFGIGGGSSKPVYALLIECDHSDFIVNNKDVWQSTKEGFKVDLQSVVDSIYTCKYLGKINGKNVTDTLNRRVKSFRHTYINGHYIYQ